MALLFAILIGCVFFSCVKNIVCSSDLGGGGKNQLAYESVWRSLSQYIYNKQLWKIFTRTYRQNDHQYPSVLFLHEIDHMDLWNDLKTFFLQSSLWGKSKNIMYVTVSSNLTSVSILSPQAQKMICLFWCNGFLITRGNRYKNKK